MKEPVDHIIRPSLPWRRDIGITECGYDASKVKAMTRQEFFQREKDLGKQRCAMVTCMTCSDTTKRYGAWEDDPRTAIGREVTWERGEYWGRGRSDRGTLLREELLAIEALIEAHRDEFETTIQTNRQRSEWLEKKAALKQKPKPPTPSRPNLL
jgi:hypothetical protein